MRPLLWVMLLVSMAAPSTASADELDLSTWTLLGKAPVTGVGIVKVSLSKERSQSDQVALVSRGGTLTIARVQARNGRACKVDATLAPDDMVAVDNCSRWGSSRISLDVTEVDGNATVEVWGNKAAGTYTELEGLTYRFKRQWDGAMLLDSKSLSGTGTIEFDADSRSVSKLVFLAIGADVALSRVEIHGDPDVAVSKLKVADSDDEFIDLSGGVGATSKVENVTFRYRVADGASTDLRLYGVRDGEVATTGSAQPAARATVDPGNSEGWTANGWVLLGEDEVDLIDDTVEFKKSKSTWDSIALVADGDPVHLETVELTTRGKKTKVQREEIAKDLGGDARVRVVEIAGGRRALSKVRLQYKKLQRDASTRLQIYAR